MTPVYDIFKVAENGEQVLLESVQNLEAAMARANSLQRSFPGEYLLVSHSTGKHIRISANGGIHRS